MLVATFAATAFWPVAALAGVTPAEAVRCAFLTLLYFRCALLLARLRNGLEGRLLAWLGGGLLRLLAWLGLGHLRRTFLAWRVGPFRLLLLRREGAHLGLIRLHRRTLPFAFPFFFPVPVHVPFALPLHVSPHLAFPLAFEVTALLVGLIPASTPLDRRRGGDHALRRRYMAPVMRLAVPGLVAIVAAPVVANDEGDQGNADVGPVLGNGQDLTHPGIGQAAAVNPAALAVGEYHVAPLVAGQTAGYIDARAGIEGEQDRIIDVGPGVELGRRADESLLRLGGGGQ